MFLVVKTSIRESLVDKTIGKKHQQMYTRTILLIHLFISCIIIYFTTGFGDPLINEMASYGSTSTGSEVTEQIIADIILSGLVLAVILRVIVYQRIISETPEIGDITNIIASLAFTSFSYFFWFFFWFLIIGTTLFVVGDLIVHRFFTDVFAGFVDLFAMVISSGIAITISSLGGSWRFPSDLREKVQDSHEKIDEIENTIKKAEKELNTQSFERSFIYLKSASSALTGVKNDQMSFRVIDERLQNTEESIEQAAEELVKQAISGTEQAINNKEYESAHEILNIIHEVNQMYEITNNESKIRLLREETNTYLENVVEEKIIGARTLIKQAATAGDESNFNQAYNNIESAKKIIDEIRSMGEAETADNINTQLHEVEKSVTQLEDEKNISKIQDSISNSHGIERQKIRIDQGTPKSYERLESLLNRIETSESTLASFLPWDQFRSGIVASLPGISETKIGTCHDIIYDIEVITKFIDNIDKSHPSVHADEWRTAMSTALSHQNQDILNPITSQINRLKENTLWKKEDLYKVDWEEFEHLIGLLYEDLGYETKVTQGTSDMGVDIWAKKGGDRIAVQVKQFSDGNTVGREVLQKLTSTIAKGDAERAIVITSGDFARTATQYAQDFGSKLEIIDGDELIQMLSESSVPAPD